MDVKMLSRLFAKFTIGDDCWLWTAAHHALGYGHFRVGGQIRPAHAVVYELLVGPIPDGLTLDHLCRTPACVRPDHVEPVTHAENVRRGTAGQWCLAKTHCPQNHPYDENNTYVSSDGKRNCRACSAARTRTRRAREKHLATR